MHSLKSLLPGIFGNTKEVLETDAQPTVEEVNDEHNNNNQLVVGRQNLLSTTTSIPNELDTQAETVNHMSVHATQHQTMLHFSNINKLHFGTVFNINSARGADESTPSVNKSNRTNKEQNTKRMQSKKTTTILTMMQAQEEPSSLILDTVSTHLGEGWKDVMRALGQSEGQIEQAIIDHQIHGGIKEVIYQLLLQWLRDADDGNATLGRLTSLLWELNHRECVQRMKLAWKSTNRKTA